MDQEGQACPEVICSPQNHSSVVRVLPILNYCQSSIQNALVQRGVVPIKGTLEGQTVAGRLTLFLNNWTKVSQDRWIQSTVQGYTLELLDNPVQSVRPTEVILSLEEQRLTHEEIQKMLLKGAITQLTPAEDQQGFYSNIFLVPKKDGGMRPVINLKRLNEFITPHHFKMEGYTL